MITKLNTTVPAGESDSGSGLGLLFLALGAGICFWLFNRANKEEVVEETNTEEAEA